MAHLFHNKARQRMNPAAGARATHSRLQIWSSADLDLLYRSVCRWRTPLCAHLRLSRCCFRHTRNDIFVCDEESQFYSQCLEKLLVKNSSSNQTVIEFGSGDGSPVIGCLIQSQFSGVIHGFELNKKAAALAHSRTIETHVSNRYKAGLHLQICATMLHAVNICSKTQHRHDHELLAGSYILHTCLASLSP